MKITFIILFLFIFTGVCFPDEFTIPFSCYSKEMQARFLEHGLKLDLDGINRTKDSFGFLRNEGTRFIIYTYHSATDEDMLIIRKIILEMMRR